MCDHRIKIGGYRRHAEARGATGTSYSAPASSFVCIIRILLLQPPGDLLWCPFQLQFPGYKPTQFTVDGKAAEAVRHANPRRASFSFVRPSPRESSAIVFALELRPAAWVE
ncbi:hypothetical protein [Paraburkholderia sp. 35.1]|uniref:hypothetical protein n=1 Tax=Paraburkholderia sp. 35.1 TaxID=2991058 RepID=UPI003D1C9257